ncbi:MAG: hypothetical protein RIQ62_1123 [Bacteroidota bacterium]|jgi:hypothetical protein
MKKITLTALSLFALLSACKKDDTTTNTSLTTQQKIQTKWNFVANYDINYLGQTTNVDFIDTINGAAGDYVDFKSNNKAYISVGGIYDTIDYAILSDTKLLFDYDTFTINTLTLTNFQFTYADRISADYYDNVIKLSR